jgi:hypothetical protein
MLCKSSKVGSFQGDAIASSISLLQVKLAIRQDFSEHTKEPKVTRVDVGAGGWLGES